MDDITQNSNMWFEKLALDKENKEKKERLIGRLKKKKQKTNQKLVKKSRRRNW